MTNTPLPIELMPYTKPPRFRWWQTVDTISGPRRVVHESPVSPALEGALVEMVERTKALQAFKDWVHAYLDAQGVPKEIPNGTHGKEGCRIGDRLDWLVAQLNAVRQEARVPTAPTPTPAPQPTPQPTPQTQTPQPTASSSPPPESPSRGTPQTTTHKRGKQ